MLSLNMELFLIFGQPLDSYFGVDRGINQNQYKIKNPQKCIYTYSIIVFKKSVLDACFKTPFQDTPDVAF
jgi:hypothetical protein